MARQQQVMQHEIMQQRRHSRKARRACLRDDMSAESVWTFAELLPDVLTASAARWAFSSLLPCTSTVAPAWAMQRTTRERDVVT